MLTELSLGNFKSWEQIAQMRLAPITGLFGANSSGKTSLLQLLLMLKQTVTSPDRNLVLNFGDDRSLVSLGTFREVIHKHSAPKLLWRIAWTLPQEMKISDPERKSRALFSDDKLSFEAALSENGSGGRLTVSEFRYSFDQREFGMRRKADKSEYSLTVSPAFGFRFIRTVGRSWPLPSPVKCYGFPDQVKAYYQNAGFLSDFELEFEKLFASIHYLGPLREYPQRQYTWAGAQPADVGHRGENVIDALLASRESDKIGRGKGKPQFSVEEYVAYWLRELGLISSFEVKPVTADSTIYQVWVKKNPAASKVLITDVGFGVSQILPVLTLCYYVPENSVIILEQPEIHLHPSVQAGLADVFIDAVKNRHIQILLESHSEHLLRRLQRRIAEEELDAKDTALYFCSAEDGVSTLTALDVDIFGSIRNWPKDFFGDEYAEIAATQKAALVRKNRAK